MAFEVELMIEFRPEFYCLLKIDLDFDLTTDLKVRIEFDLKIKIELPIKFKLKIDLKRAIKFRSILGIECDLKGDLKFKPAS